MGAGNRINPLELYACDISEIKNKKDTFVQNILYQLGKKGITSGIDVVISNEKARKPEKNVNTEHYHTRTNHNRSRKFLLIHFLNHGDCCIQNQDTNSNFDTLKCIGNKGNFHKVIQKHGNQEYNNKRGNNYTQCCY